MTAIPFTEEQINNLGGYSYPQTREYNTFYILKKGGGKRWITAPGGDLKKAQRFILDNIPTASVTHWRGYEIINGFIPGRSIIDNARPHVGKRVVLSVDLYNFFPSIPRNTIKQLLLPVTTNMLTYKNIKARNAFLLTVMHKKRLPQGSPCSPMLANWAASELDKEIHDTLCKKYTLDYTRYADDLTFSSYNDIPEAFLNKLQEIVKSHGFKIARKKVKFMRRHKQQRVTGIIVNDKLSIPKVERQRLRAFLHDAEHNGLEEALGRHNSSIAEKLGLISYISMANKSHSESFKAKLNNLRAIV